MDQITSTHSTVFTELAMIAKAYGLSLFSGGTDPLSGPSERYARSDPPGPSMIDSIPNSGETTAMGCQDTREDGVPGDRTLTDPEVTKVVTEARDKNPSSPS